MEANWRFQRPLAALVATVALTLAMASASGPSWAEDAKAKVFLSMSYSGNGWQDEAANLVRAMAASKLLRDKISLEVQVAGPDAQKQIQQINTMVQAGAKIIVIYPISPTALNQAVKNACDKGVLVFAYDGIIDEPCAYNVHSLHEVYGRDTAEWIAKQINYKGNVVMITGISGATPDTLRKGAAHAVFAKYPDIHIVGEENGMWSEPGARKALMKIMATHSWDDVNAIWAETGCYAAVAVQLEAGIPDDKLRPCVGDPNQGTRIQMLPSGMKLEGTHDAYRPTGVPEYSMGSGVFSGALALKLAVQKLEGKEVPKTTVIAMQPVTTETVKLCETGSWEEMSKGCNVFKPSVITDPEWTPDLYYPETREVGLQGALNGKPED